MSTEKSHVNNAMKTCSSCFELISSHINVSECNMCHKWFHALKSIDPIDMSDSPISLAQKNSIFRTCFECNLSFQFNNKNIEKLNELNPFQANNDVAFS